MRFIEPASNFYARFERPISSIFLILGFIFDILTLKRVDTLFENLLIILYLIIIGVFIILIHRVENKVESVGNLSQVHFWYLNILQFCFGGVFSAYLVLYFRSADIWVAWPFIAILAITFVGNEFLKHHYVRLSFQISLLFLSIYSFMIFFVPVVLNKLGTWIFLFSGFLSLIAISIFIAILFYFTKDKFKESRKTVVSLILCIFLMVNFLYFTNLIPPLPLSLKDSGVYHFVSKTPEGNYDVLYEETSWRDYFKLYTDFNRTPGSPVYVYSAIFSPNNLNITILHEWQHYDEEKDKWITETEIRLPVIGGRGGGFRTYSKRSNLTSGKWKINVKTELGQTIGHVRFNIVETETIPDLIEKLKD